MENGRPTVTNAQTIDQNGNNDGNRQARTDEATINQKGEYPQLLPPLLHHHTRTDEPPREALASKSDNLVANNPRQKFNNRFQSCHWNFTFNN
jgi:hypothetical protein